MKIWYEMTAVCMLYTLIIYTFLERLVGIKIDAPHIAFAYFFMALVFFINHHDQFLGGKEEK